MDDDRLEDVEFEISLRSGEADGRVIAHHLAANHGHGLALGRIDFAGHDGRAGFVLRNGQLAEPATRSAGQPTDVVGDFHQRAGERLERARGEDEFVVRGKRGELVRIRGEGQAGQLGDFLGGAFAEFRMRVEPGSDRGSADGEGHDPGHRGLDASHVGVEQGNVAGEFLPERDRGCVLQMGASDFDDLGKSSGFTIERIAQFADGWEKLVHNDLGRGDGHGRGKSVVRRLRHVDVVVRVDRGL